MHSQSIFSALEPFLVIALLSVPILVITLATRAAYRKKPATLLQEKEQVSSVAQPVISESVPQTETKASPEPAVIEKVLEELAHESDTETDDDDQDEPTEGTEETSSPAGVPILTVDDMRLALEQTGKTQTELAEAIGVSRFYVSKILAGKKPFTTELQSRVKAVLADWGVDAPKPLADEASPQVNSGP
jgi:antitoxin component HigA of HigAB toxin-antitoxin module